MKRQIVWIVYFFLPIFIYGQTLFTPPTMGFIHSPSEAITNLSFNSTSLSSVQSAIDDARNTYPNNILRITLSGTFTVAEVPLKLSNYTLLFLNNATILANNSTTATAMISVSNAQYVSIGSTGGGLLDGNNANLKAIEINTCGKTHIDNLTIKNCTNGGVSYSGNGQSVYADAGSVTRCNISNCTTYAIAYRNVFHFVCTDNTLQSNGIGIAINGNNSVVANNTITQCTTGIVDSSQYEAITYNSITNCTTGINLVGTSLETFVSHNTINTNNAGLTVNSTKARIYYNNCNNTTEVQGGGTNNQLFCNIGITSAEGNVSGCSYFNPPLKSNMHNDLIKIGKGRYDINIGSLSLGMLRCVMDMIHGSQPNAVIVAHLSGTFTAESSTDSFLVKEDECILLNGTFNGNVSCGTMVNFSGSLTSSFSGGTIDGQTTNGTKGLVYIAGSANAVLDAVFISNSATQGIFKQNSTVPTYIQGCTLSNCGFRGIWSLASSRLYALENNVSSSVKDGIDLDAFSTKAILIKNTCNNNKRNGVFIEEGASGHLVMANTLNSNATAGVELYNLNVDNANSSQNLLVYNSCSSNNRGIMLNAAAATKATINNTLFNNTCSNNMDVGVGGYYNATNTYNNYNAFMNIQNNTNGSYYSARDYTLNYDWNMY